MAYQLDCADTGSACLFSVTAGTEDEVMQDVATHASIAHLDLDLDAQTAEQLKVRRRGLSRTGANAVGRLLRGRRRRLGRHPLVSVGPVAGLLANKLVLG